MSRAGEGVDPRAVDLVAPHNIAALLIERARQHNPKSDGVAYDELDARLDVQAAASLKALAEQVRVLTEALQPFAKVADFYEGQPDASSAYMHQWLVSHLRAASQALAKVQS